MGHYVNIFFLLSFSSLFFFHNEKKSTGERIVLTKSFTSCTQSREKEAVRHTEDKDEMKKTREMFSLEAGATQSVMSYRDFFAVPLP